LSEITSRVANSPANDLELLSLLSEARELPFFSLFSIDMLANCAYLDDPPEECEFDACEIVPVEPPPAALQTRDASEMRFELDAWARTDPPSSDYYDLNEYPETYTAFNGSHVWDFIYSKLCFGSPALVDDDDWRNVFDRAASGLHSSISCHVAENFPSGDDDEENDDDLGVQAEFDRRLGDHPYRIANMHFAFALVLAAVREAKSSLLTFDYAVDDASASRRTAEVAHRIANQAIFADEDLALLAATLREVGATANECVLSSNEDNDFLEESGIWQMRQRSRAMERLMDCVACGVCRLHGKVAWFGIATAFKLIYADRRTNKLSRVEAAALVVALDKLASSARFAQDMLS